jgi:hypothetical protein
VTTHWLMKCFPQSEDVDWGRYGVLTFDDHWVAKLWTMASAFEQAAKTVQSLSSLVVWDYSVTFYDSLDLPEDVNDRLDKYDYIEIEPKLLHDDHRTRTECEELHVMDDANYIYWSVIVKHSDVRVDTPRIALRDFECPLHGRVPCDRGTCLAHVARL